MYSDIVTMISGKAERQRQYIVRINADPHKMGKVLMKDRLQYVAKKNRAMTQYETKHDYRKKTGNSKDTTKNKSDAEFLNQALTYRDTNRLENRQMQLLILH